MEKISIIVPVYNVQKYLDKCIESILVQTYSHLEIILIDDGSTDESGRICDYYGGIDNRIIVIHKENGGLSSARNAGLDVATGDYIGFVDSDDFIEPSMYEKMFLLLKKEECDVVECGINLCTDTDVYRFKQEKDYTMSGVEALKQHLKLDKRLLIPRTSVWSKLYKRSCWHKKRFPVGQVHEDYLLTCIIFYEAGKVGILMEGLYNHLTTNMESIVNSKFGKKDLYKQTQMKYRIDYLSDKNDSELLSLAKSAYYNNIIATIWKCNSNSMEETNLYIEIVKANIKEILHLQIPLKKKMELLLISYFSNGYFFVRGLYNSKMSKRL